MLKHLIKIINTKTTLSLANTKPNLLNSKPNITKYNVMVTNFPDPCDVCRQHQCEYDIKHTLVTAVSTALDESISKFLKKLPDDACG